MILSAANNRQRPAYTADRLGCSDVSEVSTAWDRHPHSEFRWAQNGLVTGAQITQSSPALAASEMVSWFRLKL